MKQKKEIEFELKSKSNLSTEGTIGSEMDHNPSYWDITPACSADGSGCVASNLFHGILANWFNPSYQISAPGRLKFAVNGACHHHSFSLVYRVA
jgi:hypothetical protein